MFGSHKKTITILAVIVTGAPSVAAQPASTPSTSVPSKTAQELFLEGVAAVDLWQTEPALELFRAAYALEPRQSTLLNIAECLDRLARHLEAVETLDAALLEYGSTMKDAERSKTNGRIATLEKKMKVGRLDILAPPKTKLFIDDTFHGELPLGKPLRLSAGTHVVRIERSDAKPIEREITILPAGLLILELDAVQLRPVVPKVRKTKPRARVPLEVQGGWLLGSSLGQTLNQEIMRPCSGTCSFGSGAFVGLRLPRVLHHRLTWDVSAGYVYLGSKSQHAWSSTEFGTPNVVLDSSVTLHGAWTSVGVGVHLPFGSSWQWSGHLGFASLFGIVNHSGRGELVVNGDDSTEAMIRGDDATFFVRPVVLPEIRLSRRVGPLTIGIGVLGWLSPFLGPAVGNRDLGPVDKCAAPPPTTETTVRACDLPGIPLQSSRMFGALWYVAPTLSVGAAL